LQLVSQPVTVSLAGPRTEARATGILLAAQRELHRPRRGSVWAAKVPAQRQTTAWRFQEIVAETFCGMLICRLGNSHIFFR
jgi:hypothetical protein